MSSYNFETLSAPIKKVWEKCGLGKESSQAATWVLELNTLLQRLQDQVAKLIEVKVQITNLSGGLNLVGKKSGISLTATGNVGLFTAIQSYMPMLIVVRITSSSAITADGAIGFGAGTGTTPNIAAPIPTTQIRTAGNTFIFALQNKSNVVNGGDTIYLVRQKAATGSSLIATIYVFGATL